MTISNEKRKKLKEELEAHGVKESDINEVFIRAGGSGGQKVNKTSVAVQIKYNEFQVSNSRSRSREDNRYFARRELLELVKQASGIKTKKILEINKQKKQKKRRKKKSVKKYSDGE